jgi:hypothetical protein
MAASRPWINSWTRTCTTAWCRTCGWAPSTTTPCSRFPSPWMCLRRCVPGGVAPSPPLPLVQVDRSPAQPPAPLLSLSSSLPSLGPVPGPVITVCQDGGHRQQGRHARPLLQPHWHSDGDEQVHPRQGTRDPFPVFAFFATLKGHRVVDCARAPCPVPCAPCPVPSPYPSPSPPPHPVQ